MIRRDVERRAIEDLRRQAELHRRQVQASTPVRTGLLRRSWRVIGEGLSLRLVNRVPYARLVARRPGDLNRTLRRLFGRV